MVRSARALGAVGGAVLLLGAVTGVAAAETPAASPAPEPAAARLTPPATASVGSAGIYAVGGGLVVVAGGAATWLRKRKKS
ncbi:hypothetical protein AB0K51_08430 [Kitasatospora sp. NPDC049285]|uniref:hypothetical protein n=1 Tax=Kitasatospora sp. NPDC049285 TaxID=3157096 RepID=UPI0034431772